MLRYTEHGICNAGWMPMVNFPHSLLLFAGDAGGATDVTSLETGKSTMNFFSTLLHPDREELEMEDRMIVSSAANILQVGEFQLLQLAYQEWFGEDLPEAMVTQVFSAYMLRNEVPHWARHYARVILMREEQGILAENDARYHRYDHQYHTTVPRGVQQFCLVSGLLALALVAGIVIANSTVTQPTTRLPPYFDREELKKTPPQPAEDQRAPAMVSPSR